MIARQLVMIDAEHHGQIHALAGGGDQYALCSGIEMLLAAGPVGEKTGAFKRNVDAIGGVRQVGRIALRRDLDALAVDDQIVATLVAMLSTPVKYLI